MTEVGSEYKRRVRELEHPGVYELERGAPACDIVMKGGITSGVVYPLAICELATSYKFERIGGTSAGAIAAVATAASEFRRRQGSGVAFAEVAKLPAWLGRDDHLKNMFQPQPDTAAIFNTALSATGQHNSRLTAGLRALQAALGAYKANWMLLGLAPAVAFAILWILLAKNDWDAVMNRPLLPTLAPVFIVPGALVLAMLWRRTVGKVIGLGLILIGIGCLVVAGVFGPGSGGGWVGLIAGTALLLVLGLGLAIGAGLWRSVLYHIPENRYGMCSGMGNADALTPWLASYLEDRAFDAGDCRRPGEPLTFGHLWTADRRLPDRAASDEEIAQAWADRDADAARAYDKPRLRCIDLRSVTTNLTLGRPYEFPIGEEGLRQFYFHEDDFLELFPSYVVQWMVDHPNTERNGTVIEVPADARLDGRWAGLDVSRLHPLPAPWHMPVVVAARMSLSFPVLLSAVPLWRVEQRLGEPAADGSLKWTMAWAKCWFSDGGISSNFPVHLFDDPLPAAPTFALNLRGVHSDFPISETERNNVFVPDGPLAGTQPWFNRFDDAGPSLTAFLGRVLDTARNWHDNSRLTLAAYRDRVAHLSLGGDEGGLNLKMPPETITRLCERGWNAGRILCENFGENGQSWSRHRWRRYRVTMEAFGGFLETFDDKLRQPTSAEPYDEMISEGKESPAIPVRHRQAAHQANEAMSALAAQLRDDGWEEWERVPDAPFDLELRPRI